MLGKCVPFGNVPFHRAKLNNKEIQFIGDSTGHDEVFFDGDPNGSEFIAYFIKADKVLAVAAQGREKDLLTLMEAMQLAKLPTASAIKSGEETPATILPRLLMNKGASKCRRANYCKKKTIVQ